MRYDVTEINDVDAGGCKIQRRARLRIEFQSVTDARDWSVCLRLDFKDARADRVLAAALVWPSNPQSMLPCTIRRVVFGNPRWLSFDNAHCQRIAVCIILDSTSKKPVLFMHALGSAHGCGRRIRLGAQAWDARRTPAIHESNGRVA